MVRVSWKFHGIRWTDMGAEFVTASTMLSSRLVTKMKSIPIRKKWLYSNKEDIGFRYLNGTVLGRPVFI